MLQVLLGDNCHIYNYEAGGISALGGIAFHVLHNEPNGEILLENLQAAIRYYSCSVCLATAAAAVTNVTMSSWIIFTDYSMM